MILKNTKKEWSTPRMITMDQQTIQGGSSTGFRGELYIVSSFGQSCPYTTGTAPTCVTTGQIGLAYSTGVNSTLVFCTGASSPITFAICS